MSLVQYTFASMVHRGFRPTETASAHIQVAVGATPAISHDVPMMTPADATGIPAREVIRTWPRHGSTNVEPNYLALVEFDAPDLPWLLSRPGAGGHVHPWVALAVLDVTDADPVTTTDRGTQVTVDVAELPDPAEAWLWAHGQLLGTDTVPEDPSRSLSRLLCPRRMRPNRSYLGCVVPVFASGRDAGLGKDVAATRTSPDFAWTPGQGTVTLPVYHSFRFATGPSGDFEALVRRLHGVPLPAGMGERRLRLDHPLSGMPAPETPEDLLLHVALRPPGASTSPVLPLVGQSYLDVLRSRLADGGYDLSLLTGPDAPPPRVGPPVYGQLPVGKAATAAALGTPVVPPWLTELNLDPRHRVAAGLGAAVVRANQDHYVESAWRQVGEVLAANRLRRRAEYSVAASTRLYQRWIGALSAGDLLTATAPVHAKVLTAPAETIVGRLRDSPIPPAVVSVELRRLTRARGALVPAAGWRASANVAQLASHSAEASPLVHRVALDSVEVLAAPSAVWGSAAAKATLHRLSPELDVTALSDAQAADKLDAASVLAQLDIPTTDVVRARVAGTRPDLDSTLGEVGLLPTSAVLGAVGDPGDVVRPVRPVPPVRRVRPSLRADDQLGRIGQAIRMGPLVPSPRFGGQLTAVLGSDVALGAVTRNPELVSRVGGRVSLDTAALDIAARSGTAATTLEASVLDRIIAGTFRPAKAPVPDFAVPAASRDALLHEMGEVIVGIADHVIRPEDAAVAPGRPLAGGLESLRQLVVAALDPRTTIRRAIDSRISAGLGALPVDDILAAPDLSEPTYGQLGALSHDWLLPGIDQLPADTTTLVSSNREFIEAFLVGMNHELARELLWREYPTDQRGTYARQFWSHLATRARTDQFDLKVELHKTGQVPLDGLSGQAADPLVLVVKGDLVKRYPGVIICAARTRPDPANAGHRLLDPARTLQPDFVGLLEPDVMLVGFSHLLEQDVRNLAGQPDQAWWFFFAEHFAEPRFGFDELVVDEVELRPDEHRAWTDPSRSWNDAAWQYATLDDRGFLTAGSFAQNLAKGADPTATPTKHAWGHDAAAQAWIALQFPFRRGIPASTLLPPGSPA